MINVNMDHARDNPTANVLPPGLSETQVDEAIGVSGYPLQVEVATALRTHFWVQDEWSFVDHNSGKLRALDIRARTELWDLEGQQPRVRPALSLLVECKKASLPYVFFLAPSQPSLLDFPLIAGLHHDKIEITSDTSASTWTFPIPSVLGLDRHSFVTTPPLCRTFSRVVRKGSDVVLSGTEPYQALILPLSNALRHHRDEVQPPETAYYFDCVATMAVGVLDATMVGVRRSSTGTSKELLPWVRVLRHEFHAERVRQDRSRLVVVDLVHEGFLASYISDHLLPYAEAFAKIVLEHQREIAEGRAFAPGMDHHWGSELPNKLRPRDAQAGSRRARAVLAGLGRIVRGKGR